jgi:hypothetical protein
MKIEDLHEAIIAVSQVVMPTVPVMVAQQNIARPDWALYGTILIVNDQLIGLPESLSKDETENLNIENIIRQRRHATVSINFYRPGAQAAINAFMAAWFSMAGIEIQQVRNIGFRGFSGVRNIATAVHENFEERAQVDLHLSYIHQFDLTHDTIGSFNITGYFEGDRDTTQIDVNVMEPQE